MDPPRKGDKEVKGDGRACFYIKNSVSLSAVEEKRRTSRRSRRGTAEMIRTLNS